MNTHVLPKPAALAVLLAICSLWPGGCKSRNTPEFQPIPSFSVMPMPGIAPSGIPESIENGGRAPVAPPVESQPPPQVTDYVSLVRVPMSLDDAVRMALDSSPVIRQHGGQVLVLPDSVRTTFDPAAVAADPNVGPAAALSAFDTQLETGLVWNGGGRAVNSSFSSGQFGVFSQPQTLAKVGLGRVLASGTRVSVGGVGGYDEELAGGPFAAYGAKLRHPLSRGRGREHNRIAGPLAKPGVYGGVLIAQINETKARYDLEMAVRNLVRDVAISYWQLYYAYRHLATEQSALENARRSWHREQQRAAEQVTPADAEALARGQFHSAQAAVLNAISGIAPGPSGVYAAELRLRSLVGLPAFDGRLIEPAATPLEAPLHFDWGESVALGQSRRVELRRQAASVHRKELELVAAKNLSRPQLDLVGTYRRLADDPTKRSATFSEALDGWQVGLEYSRALGGRRENAAVQSATLQLNREEALLTEQHRQLVNEMRAAFTELDRTWAVMQSLATARDAARIRLDAESSRHAAGDAHVERVLEAQVRATQAETAWQRILVDYNLAFIQVHLARGTFLETLGVGFAGEVADQYRFAQTSPSIFAQPTRIRR